MKVYIAWSGEESRYVAGLLRDWLPMVLQAVQPWLAPDDLRAGNRVSEQRWDSGAVILCVTRANLDSTWLAFEAGLATQLVERDLAIPLLIGVAPSELRGPLGNFQSVTFDDHGIKRLAHRLNTALETPLPEPRLDSILAITRAPSAISKAAGLSNLARSVEAADIYLGVERAGPPISGHPDEDPSPRITDSDTISAILTELRTLTNQVSALYDRVGSEVRSETLAASFDEAGGKPRVFIGSSAEGLSIAEAIQAGLEHEAECTVWNQHVFRPSATPIEGLVELSVSFDFAIIVLTADDLVTTRGSTANAPRDNLIFELGLFTGTLGRARTFLVICRDDDVKLPSDLNGVTTVQYSRRRDGNLRAAVGPVCLRVKEVMGVRREPPNPGDD